MSDMNEVLEYLFFTREMADEFVAKLTHRGLEYVEEIEPVQEAIVLKIAEGVDDDLWDELDDYYDELSAKDQALVEEATEDEAAHSAAGVYLQLEGGKQTLAQVDPDMMSRILSVLSMDEFNQFVDVIVRSVENPDDSAICKVN
ncbi:MAG: Unknown protein [uncultured Thiotrichaceae bacterium]|uniref:Uncharacterized protein n=1 Tax=uncultured Thiotrichaceae bacterium TaxID=298394 RepID=A0A6S6S8V9_9GAMM|nr:MAG: Unknown protein [uncultured Thiotrichaceae bacterium]